MTAVNPVEATRLNQLLTRVGKELEGGLLPVEVFGDEEVFKAELDRIFGRSWLFLAHETEIPNRGDYVVRNLGLDRVIVSRAEDGSVNVLLNYCRHRGTELCHTEQGNTSHFRCRFHGWIYKNNGDWLGAPHFKQAYRELDPSSSGLVKAAHVDSYHGMIFGTLSPEAPPLKEYLGDATWFLDAIFGLHPDGMKVIGAPERFLLRTNWKVGAESFAGDVYHLEPTHASLVDIGAFKSLDATGDSCQFDIGNGHCFAGHATRWFRLWGYDRETVAHFDLDSIEPAQRKMIEERAPMLGTIFPNLSFIRESGHVDLSDPADYSVYTSIRLTQPIAPGLTELWVWQLSWKFLSEEAGEKAYKAGITAFGSSGFFEQDDTVVWEGVAKAGASAFARKAGMTLNYQLGLGGMSDSHVDDTWEGPGTVYTPAFTENNQRSFHKQWLKEMQKQ